jgi:N-acetylmuramoyl-L-alanine amidase
MKYIAGFVLVLVWGSLACAQNIAVKPHTAELRDSTDPYTYRVVLMVPRYYPLAVDSEVADFFEVHDYQGRTGWIAKKDTYAPETVVIDTDGNKTIRKMKTVVIKSQNINIRSGPGTDQGIVFRADQGVAFKVLGQKGEWLEVVHETGAEGWLHVGLVWGG